MMYAAGMAGGLSGRAGGSKKSGCNCFKAGTKVQTDEGEKDIEDIEVGDKVLSKDENSPDGELAFKEVTGLYRNRRDDIIKLYVGEQVIETTDNHPFWVEKKGWVFADELQARDKLQKTDGSNLTIDKVEFIKLEEKVTVYNFTVADYHTYYVTDIGIWVHNTNCGINQWGRSETLTDHYTRHGGDFGAADEAEYAAMAQAFFNNSSSVRGVLVKVDNGIIKIYDPSTNTFGSYNANGTTRTFYKPSSQTYFQRQNGEDAWISD